MITEKTISVPSKTSAEIRPYCFSGIKPFSFGWLITIGYTIAIFFSVPLDADFGWYEAARHAMDGIFYKDLIMDGGILDPIKYTFSYYQQYPAITPVMYPPFFGIAQSLGFAILGYHPWVARAMVLLFLGWSAVGLKKLTNDWLGEEESWYASLFYLSMPLVIYWSRDVMLEAPAMALIIWSFYCFQRYLKENKTKHLVWWTIFATLCPYTKQNTVFIFPAFFLSAMLSKKMKAITDRRFLIALFISFLCGIPLIFITLKWGMLNIEQSFGHLKEPLTPIEHILFYFKYLPESLGWIILAMSAIGIIFIFKKRICSLQNLSIEISILIGWTALCYLQMVLIKIKEPRHGFFWMPIFAILAVVGLKSIQSYIPSKRWGRAFGAILIIGIFSNNLINSKINWSQGFYAPAAYLKSHWDGNAVLINIFRDAHFTFRLRAIDTKRNFRIYRSDKIFESMAIYKEWGVKPLISTQGEFLDALAKYGIRYLLIQDPMPLITGFEKTMRQALNTDKFEKVKDFEIICPNNAEATLYLYRFKGKIDSPGVIPPIHLPVVGKIIKSRTSL